MWRSVVHTTSFLSPFSSFCVSRPVCSPFARAHYYCPPFSLFVPLMVVLERDHHAHILVLTVVCFSFVCMYRDKAKTPGSKLTLDQVQHIFSNVEPLCDFHTVFLADLQRTENIPSVFLKYADYLKMYTQVLLLFLFHATGHCESQLNCRQVKHSTMNAFRMNKLLYGTCDLVKYVIEQSNTSLHHLHSFRSFACMCAVFCAPFSSRPSC